MLFTKRDMEVMHLVNVICFSTIVSITQEDKFWLWQFILINITEMEYPPWFYSTLYICAYLSAIRYFSIIQELNKVIQIWMRQSEGSSYLIYVYFYKACKIKCTSSCYCALYIWVQTWSSMHAVLFELPLLAFCFTMPSLFLQVDEDAQDMTLAWTKVKKASYKGNE